MQGRPIIPVSCTASLDAAELYIVRREIVTEIQGLYFYKYGNYMWKYIVYYGGELLVISMLHTHSDIYLGHSMTSFSEFHPNIYLCKLNSHTSRSVCVLHMQKRKLNSHMSRSVYVLHMQKPQLNRPVSTITF